MNSKLNRMGLAAAIAAMAAISTPAHPQQADSASILIYDASGSMWGRLESGETKVEAARDVIGDFFASRDRSIPLGVIAYGHNRRGDCSDIEVVAGVGIEDPAQLSARLNRLNPRGMTPITESLSLAASMIPPTAESADIILVTDGLETCRADPCALAAQLAEEGIAIRAHVVGFGLSDEEAEVMACVANATGGLLLTPQSGRELADALDQVARLAPPEAEPEIEPEVAEAFFDIGPRAEAGYNYSIGFRGEARNTDYAGFTRRGEGRPRTSGSYGPIGGGAVANNPFTVQAPAEPGEYDLILVRNDGRGVAVRQPIEVVPPSNGFDAIGSVEPDMRFEFTWRGPDQVGQRIVIARPEAEPNDYAQSWGYPYNNRRTQRMRLTAPAEPGIYELRYITGNQREILFSRTFGVGVPFEDGDSTNTAELAARAAARTQAAPGQDAMPAVRATFRTPPEFPQIPLWWDAVPLDPDMRQEAYAPISELVVWDNEFEPGRYRVSAEGPGETRFSAVVEIFPGQDNDFVVPVVAGGDEEAAADTLTGPWEVYGVPPWEVDAGLDLLLRLDLAQASASAPISGTWTATARLGGEAVDGRTGAMDEGSIDADGLLRLRFEVGAPIPAPFALTARRDGIGFPGGLSAGASGIRVVVWPAGYEPPPLDELRAGLHGPDPRRGGAAPERRGEAPAGPVPVRLLTPFEIGGKRVQWSAVRTDEPEPDVAFAMNDFEHMIVVELEPGTYAVEGVNEDEGVFLAGTIVVTPGGQNSFEIPVAGGGDRGAAGSGLGADVAFACPDRPGGCEVRHRASGLAVTLPPAWSMTEPYFYETAGGAAAAVPTATFFSEQSGDVVRLELNPRQWLESNGPCRNVGESWLCGYRGQGPAGDAAFDLIHASLSVAGAPSGDVIGLTLLPTVQFDTACFIAAEVSNPSGEAFTLFAPIAASAGGRPVEPALNPGAPAVIEVSTYTEVGASLTPVALTAPCDDLAVTLGPVQCRMGVGDGGPMTDCPLRVEASATPEFADLALRGAGAGAPPPAPARGSAPAPAASADGVFPIDLGGRDPQQILQRLIPSR